MFTLSFCFPPYKSQSHNISFSTASWAAPGPRLVDGVVIWHHKTSLQRAFPHSNIYWPIKHRVIWVKRVPVFRCSPLTERCRLGERFMRLAIVRQLAGSTEWLHAGYVSDGESEALLGILSKVDVSDSQFAEPELCLWYRQKLLSLLCALTLRVDNSGDCCCPPAVITGTSHARWGLFSCIQYQMLLVIAERFVCLLQMS